MAAFKIMKGPSSRIDTTITPYHEGYAWFTPDDGKFYIDAAISSGADNSPSALLVSNILTNVTWDKAGTDGNVILAFKTDGLALSDGMFTLSDGDTMTTLMAKIDAIGAEDNDGVGFYDGALKYENGAYSVSDAGAYSIVQYDMSTRKVVAGSEMTLDRIAELGNNSAVEVAIEKRICINPNAPRILLDVTQPSDLTEQDIWYKEVV